MKSTLLLEFFILLLEAKKGIVITSSVLIYTYTLIWSPVMPTPVSSARQCLTDEASRALDDAVSVARRRRHPQTASMHAVSALLSLPSSLLRDACARARSSAYPPCLQFRALELAVGFSLDRLPSSKATEEPPVSNSLMAAIKRSQANQRRHPESFHLHQLQIQQQQQQQQQSSTMPLSIVKVELKHFVLSILDDPIVSKVFGEAGFRSYDIKLAILNPPAPPLLPRFSCTRCMPHFLRNLPYGDSSLGTRGFNFSFSSPPFGSVDGDDNCRRIGEVLVKNKGKNPFLIGVCASHALSSFVDFVQKEIDGVLPAQISGLKLICIKKEVSEFVAGGGSEEQLGLKFKELSTLMAEHCSGPGVIISFGELGSLVGEGASGDALSHVVSKLTDLLKRHGEKLWLIGAVDSDEIFSKFLARFPYIEKEWDLHRLPLTSSRPSSIEGVHPKSSLIGSFVPFGGFFSTPSDFKSPVSDVIQSESRCHLCNEKYEQEVSAILKVSVSDQYSASLPSWLQMVELDTSQGTDAAKAKDGGIALNAKVMAMQKKWNDTCQRLQHTKAFPLLSCSQLGSRVLGAEDLRFVAVGKQTSTSSPNENQCMSTSRCATVQVIGTLLSKQKLPIQVSQPEKTNFLPQLQIRASESQQSETGTPQFPPKSQSYLNLLPDHTMPSSVASGTTDLRLGMQYASTSQEPKQTDFGGRKNRLQHHSGSVTATIDVVSAITSKEIPQQSSGPAPNVGGQLNPRDFKILWKSLSEKVGWQDEAIHAISETVSLHRTGSQKHRSSTLKGDIWLSFLGPDKLGKKRVATALAEVIFGSSESLISVDLSSQYGVSQSNSVFHRQESNNYHVNFRGKTIVDFIAGELSKKPHSSVVFLENVDKADLLAQSSLSQAIRTGNFPDSHGRTISINNMIFVTTSTVTKSDDSFLPEKNPIKFSEENILSVQSWQMQILVKSVAGDVWRNNKGMSVFVTPSGGLSNATLHRKRHLLETSNSAEQDGTPEVPKRANRNLDLNLPVEEMEEGIGISGSDCDCVSGYSDTWLTDFYNNVDLKVVFGPFDFDALAKKVLKEININFQKTMGCEALLEIDSGVMVQILAAAWSSDGKRAVEDWIQHVLVRSFTEARQSYNPTALSVLKLVAREGLPVEEPAPGIHLPAKIILN